MQHDRGQRQVAHQHRHHAVVDLDTHILEESGGKELLDGLGGLFVGHGIAHLDRQIVENRAGFRALNDQLKESAKQAGSFFPLKISPSLPRMLLPGE